jgi:hypothetical protein
MAKKEMNLPALFNPVSHAIRNVAQLLKGQRHVTGLCGSFLQRLGQAKSATGKNKTGQVTLYVQKVVSAGSAPIEIFNEIAYRVDHALNISPIAPERLSSVSM